MNNNSSTVYHDLPEFRECVDNVIRMAEHDIDIAGGLKRIDKRAREQCCSFYEAVLISMQKHQAEIKARAWLANR